MRWTEPRQEQRRALAAPTTRTLHHPQCPPPAPRPPPPPAAPQWWPAGQAAWAGPQALPPGTCPQPPSALLSARHCPASRPLARTRVLRHRQPPQPQTRSCPGGQTGARGCRAHARAQRWHDEQSGFGHCRTASGKALCRPSAARTPGHPPCTRRWWSWRARALEGRPCPGQPPPPWPHTPRVGTTAWGEIMGAERNHRGTTTKQRAMTECRREADGGEPTVKRRAHMMTMTREGHRHLQGA
jgi:hypothetical protein